jgi:hypothetical protein
MKLLTKPTNKLIFSLLTLCALFGITTRGNAQTNITVKVDTSQSWVGFMNWFNLPANGGAYVAGGTWGTAALQAVYLGTTNLDLSPCTNVWETTDTYWVQANGTTPNKIMDANFYVDTTSLIDTNVTFVGTCLSNTLTANPEPLTGVSYTCTAFIKTYNANYSTELSSISSNMVAGQPFSITLNTTGAAHVQYGFETTGPDVSPTEYPSLGNVVIAATNTFYPPPPNAAAEPTNSPSGVLALYDSSGEYSTVSGVDWLASWSAAGETNYTISNTTAQVLEYTGLQYAGVNNFNINVGAYNELHIDVWTTNANQFGVELVSLDNYAGYGFEQSAQVNFGSANIVHGKWVGLDIPLSEFQSTNNTLDLTALQQLVFVDDQAGGITGGIFYIDNVYFYSNSTLPAAQLLPQPTTAAPTPTQSDNVVAMWDSSGVYSEGSVQDWDATWSGPGSQGNIFTIPSTSDGVLEYPNMQYAGVEFYDTEADQINASADNTMHVDLWTPNANQFGIQLVSLDETNTQGGQVNFTPASGTIVSNKWVSLDIPLCDFTAAPNSDPNAVDNILDITNLQQLLWIDNQGGGGVTGGYFYIDNVYFYESSTAQPVPITVTGSKGTISISLPTELGFTYTLQYTTSLTNPSWQTLSSSVTGDNYMQTLTDTDTPGSTTRFYRVSITATP